LLFDDENIALLTDGLR
jgi:hypothetical protein